SLASSIRASDLRTPPIPDCPNRRASDLVAQLSVKGRAQVNGDKPEIQKMVEDHKQNKPPPTPVIQAVSSIAMAEAILLSKSLGIDRKSTRLNSSHKIISCAVFCLKKQTN